jgi:hypothetical protein
VGGRAGDPPAQRVRVRGVEVVVAVRVVLAPPPADDRLQGTRRPARVGVAVRDQPVPARDPGLPPRQDLRPHPVEVGLGVEEAGVGAALRLRRADAGGAEGGEVACDDRSSEEVASVDSRAEAQCVLLVEWHGASLRHAVSDAGECHRVTCDGPCRSTAGQSRS